LTSIHWHSLGWVSSPHRTGRVHAHAHHWWLIIIHLGHSLLHWLSELMISMSKGTPLLIGARLALIEELTLDCLEVTLRRLSVKSRLLGGHLPKVGLALELLFLLSIRSRLLDCTSHRARHELFLAIGARRPGLEALVHGAWMILLKSNLHQLRRNWLRGLRKGNTSEGERSS
jgi:hypothetical protein